MGLTRQPVWLVQIRTHCWCRDSAQVSVDFLVPLAEPAILCRTRFDFDISETYIHVVYSLVQERRLRQL